MRRSVTLVLFLCAISLGQTTQPAAPIVELRGDGAAMGKACGEKISPAIRALDEGYLGKAMSPGAHQHALEASALFRQFVLPEHLAEIDTLASASGMDPGEMLLANCFLDLAPNLACSTITLPADAAPDHVARFARNLDFSALGIADKYSIVFIYHPTGRYSFATIGWPGMIGALSGMNQHGLALANMEVPRQPVPPRAMPYTLLYRMLLERCKTVDEAVDLLRNTPRQSANNLMLMDASGHRAVVELTPDAVVVREGESDAALISTNHQRDQDTETRGLCSRYDYLHDAAKQDFGKIDRDDLQAMLRHVQQDGATLQSMIFEPANRVIYLSTRMNAADGEMRKIDLNDYFDREK